MERYLSLPSHVENEIIKTVKKSHSHTKGPGSEVYDDELPQLNPPLLPTTLCFEPQDSSSWDDEMFIDLDYTFESGCF
jgi:hypothetical protein